jgi:hypothetical protein
MIFGTRLTVREEPSLRIPDERQAERPHVFVTKMRDRRRACVVLGNRDKPSRDISAQEFTSAHAAFEFGAAFDVLLDTHVTLDFGRLDKHQPEEVQVALSQFTRCYAAWCNERLITPAWVASVEMASDYSYHAHVAVHVPGDLGTLAMPFRGDFRAWAKGYTARRGGWVPRAIRVRCGRKESLLTHWIVFHYLMKGYDRTAVMRSARNCNDGRAIMLGDLIARHYRDPGPVALNRRVSISNTLGPKRREFGAPTGREFMLPQGPNWGVFKIDRHQPLTLQEELTTRWQVPIPTPFGSTIEEGIFDVRRLYSPCFYELVTKLPASVAMPSHEEAADEARRSYLRAEIERFGEVAEELSLRRR